ncbi:MAG: molybdopterin-dependent oxidoreductase, partial [Janthinobacterium lividum]
MDASNTRKLDADAQGVETPGYCTLCRSRCGTLNTVRAGSLTGVRPDPAHPTGGAMCMKGRAAPELVHSPHRLRHPLRRTQPKTAADPGWERISWDEALREIAARLGDIRAQSGAEAVAFAVTTPSGTPLSDSIDWIERFVRHFGSPNICYATEICNWHKDHAHAFTFGCGMPTPDVAHADLVMLWGYNPASTWLAQANATASATAASAAAESGAGGHRARLLVVDPRPTPLARQADLWLRVRPGTDGALALGLIHLLIADDAFDRAFVRRWTNGPVLIREDTGAFLLERDVAPLTGGDCPMVWNAKTNAPATQAGRPRGTDGANIAEGIAVAEEAGAIDATLRGRFQVDIDGVLVVCHPAFELLAREAAAYPPERVAALTSVPGETLRAAARLIGASRRVAYHAWSGVAQHTNATQTERAIAVLYALTGCFDDVGGNRLHPTHAANPISEFAQLAPRQAAKALGLAARPLGPPARGWVTARDTYRAILDGVPYRIRALFGFGANPLSSQGDTALAQEALAALEFHVHCDLFETPTARYADILLPVGTPWEREGLRVGFELNAASQQRVQLRRQLVAPQGEARGDNDIVFDLACRLGMGEAFFGGSLEAGWNHMLAPLGLTVAHLREHPAGVDLPLPARTRLYENAGFATETRRVELYSALLLRHGQPPLPTYVAPAETARAGTAFPITLSSAKNGYFCHSQHRGLVSLRQRAPAPTIELAPALAASRDIAGGDPVIVSTRHGSARFVARLADTLAADVAVAEFGWWQACPEIGAPGFALTGPDNSHYNGLIAADAVDPVSGSVAHRSFRCEIVRDPRFDVGRRSWTGWRRFVVREVTPLAEDVVGIRVAPLDAGGLPDYAPGQHVTMRVDTGGDGDEAARGGTAIAATAATGTIEAGEAADDRMPSARPTLTRAYSLTGAARGDPNSARRDYTIAVRHQRGVDAAGVPWQGALSSHLHTRLAPGSQLDLQAPAGRFTLPVESAQPVVLIAGGIGIAPFVSQLETIARRYDGASFPNTLANTLANTLSDGAGHILDDIPGVPGSSGA